MQRYQLKEKFKSIKYFFLSKPKIIYKKVKLIFHSNSSFKTLTDLISVKDIEKKKSLFFHISHEAHGVGRESVLTFFFRFLF